MSGLDKGAGYRLYGYTFDGRQRPLVNWTGRDGVQELDGELRFGITGLSPFAVTRGTTGRRHGPPGPGGGSGIRHRLTSRATT